MENNRNSSFCIKLADTVIRIEPLYGYIEEYCRGYITDEPEKFTVRTESGDIDFERERSAKEDIAEGRPVVDYSDEYLETLAVYRKIAEKLTMSGIVLFHGSVVAVDGIGYLFTAKSGTGKSTHTRLWREHFGNRAVMVNDDKPLLKITENGVIACGTPWNGKHRLSTDISVPLKAVCVLSRDSINHIEEAEPKKVYPLLLQQTYRPMDKISMIQTLKLLDLLVKNVKIFRLGCNMSPEAARVAFEGMNR
ncbi:MAG: hypothetical protein E7505_10280 [Ruminococcus sp.]|nr:hypothetical protein [Ruminococcus sp.]